MQAYRYEIFRWTHGTDSVDHAPGLLELVQRRTGFRVLALLDRLSLCHFISCCGCLVGSGQVLLADPFVFRFR